jgi:hypothetical protein
MHNCYYTYVFIFYLFVINILIENFKTCELFLVTTEVGLMYSSRFSTAYKTNKIKIKTTENNLRNKN